MSCELSLVDKVSLGSNGMKNPKTDQRNCHEISVLIKRILDQFVQNALLIVTGISSGNLSISFVRKNFEQALYGESEAALKHCLVESSLNFDVIVLAAINIVCIKSLQSTEEFLQKISEKTNCRHNFDKTFHKYIMHIVEIICFLLNPINWKYIRTFAGNCYEDFINAKRKILRKYLIKEVKGNLYRYM